MTRHFLPSALLLLPAVANAAVTPIDLAPSDVGSGNTTYFTTAPTADPSLFFGAELGANAQVVNFNTAPDGALSEGIDVNTQYASLGVTMNDIRISSDIYGGNNYGAGFAAEDDAAQVFSFSTPVIAVGIVNTSPDRDLIEFFSGPNATGNLLFSFRDQEGVASFTFNIDRFVGGIADDGVTIGSFRISNASGNLELDELIFTVPEPASAALLIAGAGSLFLRRRR